MILKSSFPDVAIPNIDLGRFVLNAASERGNAPAIVDALTARTITYAELEDQARRLAAGLMSAGLRPGDVVALMASNSPDYAVVFHAVVLAGGVITTINPTYVPEEITRQLTDSGAKFLIADPKASQAAAKAARIAAVPTMMTLHDERYRQLATCDPAADLPPIDPATAIAAMPYSSGTTGRSKGVLLSHRNLVANLCQLDPIVPLTEKDVVIGVLPFFHIYGMQVLLNYTLRAGAKIVTMPRFELEGFLRAIEQHRVTRAYVVPPIVLALAKHPLVEQFDLSSLEVVTSGAAPLAEDLEATCRTRLRCQVTQGLGMTEASPVTHAIPVGDEPRAVSAGLALPNIECRIVDPETGQDVAPDGRGELWVRGPNVMLGYHNNPEASLATVDDDGWLHTGDVAVVDDAGYFSIVGRIKELIKYKGFQVSPAELEALLVTHPAVADVAVIGIPDEEAGEIPKAFVVRNAAVTEEELFEFVAARTASYKRIREIEFVDVIPRSASGKILRRILKEREH